MLVSPKRKRQEIQTQQNKNIKVLTSLPQVKLMSDVSEPPNKISKVLTHLKQLTQSDVSAFYTYLKEFKGFDSFSSK